MTPLGGKVQTGTESEATRKEREDYQEYKKELLACPPVNSNENATRLRSVMVKHNRNLIQLFSELNLNFQVPA